MSMAKGMTRVVRLPSGRAVSRAVTVSVYIAGRAALALTDRSSNG